MFKKWNRILAFLLSIALVTTTFGSDFASAKVYAEENEIVEESDDTEEPKEDEYNVGYKYPYVACEMLKKAPKRIQDMIILPEEEFNK